MLPEIDEIKRRRKKLGISQKKLAELVGVSQPLIARIESGRFDPKLSLIKRIFQVLEELEGRNVVARSIMHSPVISVCANDTVKKAAELMIKHEISQMPVVEGEDVIGSITEIGIVKAVIERGPAAEGLPVKEIMEHPFPSVPPNEGLKVISKLLLENPAVLVVEKGDIVGIITKQDIMKFLLAFSFKQ